MMSKTAGKSYRATLVACYIAYTVQALVNNTSPILFVLYESDYGVSLTMLANIILINFITQITADLVSLKLVDIFGCRKLAFAAHICSALGLIGLGTFPKIMPAYVGIVAATVLSAIGSGLIEVIISPIVDALPTENQSSSMTLLHSFYCWGSMFCVLAGTLLVKLLGDNWFILPMIFAVIPLFNIFTFTRAKFSTFTEKNIRVPVKNIIRSPLFIIMMVIMICAGASEITISQWASFFIENALGVTKVVGDILGPCLFAAFMGIGRIVSGRVADKISLEKIMLFCAAGAVLCYLGTSLLSGVFALAACALSGLTVSLMWPATLTCASMSFRGAGMTLFSILAVAGDIGCSLGPWIAGYVSDAVIEAEHISATMTPEQYGLRAGILVCTLFPLIMFFAILAVILIKKKKGR